MRAYAAQHGGLVEVDVPEPVAGPGQLVVEVHAAGLNAADVAMITGHYVSGASIAAPASDLAEPIRLGAEAAGTVVAVGAGVETFRPGDRVMSVCSGAFSPQAIMYEQLAMPVPAHLTWSEAAAIPVTFATAHDALASAGRLAPGERVLVTAAPTGFEPVPPP